MTFNSLIFKSLRTLSLCALIPLQAHAIGIDLGFQGLDLIYGEDNRIEIDLYPDQSFVDKGNAVALRVSKKRLTEDRNDSTRILFPNILLKNSMPQLCEDEKYLNQVALGTCSGFLVGTKTLVTAGHCMTTERECSDNRWVFGYKEGVTELKSSQIYSCKKIINQKYVYSDTEVSDYAVIELDRDVVGATPLTVRKFGAPLYGTPLLVIGHPMGIPMKATDGAEVKRMNDIEREHPLRSLLMRTHYFTTNLDSYSGNSGSPVFNKKTGKVEGILVQGADDFVYNEKRECEESRKLSDSYKNSYEKVMRITKVPGL